MKELSHDDLLEHFSAPVFRTIGQTADRLGVECYVVGGYVRDLFLERKSVDIDIVVVGSGVDFALEVAKDMGKPHHLSVFRNFGTAQLKVRGLELEFVGARKESYNRGSRKPIVEDGTLEDDQNRRDFTINAMAVCLNAGRYAELDDPFDGMWDLRDRIIRTPLEPEVTFSDDPLRMMRCVRFATQLGFSVEEETMSALGAMKERIGIVSGERVSDELQKILKSPAPSLGFILMHESGLLSLVLPELEALSGVEKRCGRGHKDNFRHTLEVLDNVARESDNLYLRWAALLHDIGKATTKRYDERLGWTFHSHNIAGAHMVPQIFRRLHLPLGEEMKYVQKLVNLHMRPSAIADDEVTDSAVRRLMFETGEHLDDLMILCRADITSRNNEKKERFRQNFIEVQKRIVELREKDAHRTYQPPVSGEVIMKAFDIPASNTVGMIKTQIKEAIWNSRIDGDYDSAYRLMLEVARKDFGLEEKRPVSFEEAVEMDKKKHASKAES